MYGYKVEEDPLEFIYEVFKILDAMGVYSKVKSELTAYNLKDVAQVLYEKWKDESPIIEGQITWGTLKMTVLDRFFPLVLK